MRNRKTTLSVGIPAYNEALNLPALIESIQTQNESLFTLKQIIVVSDHGTDNTPEIMNNLCSKDKRIRFIENKTRGGKARALNTIYGINTSDYLFIPDADIVIKTHDSLNEMIKVFMEFPETKLVGARHIPAQSATLMARFASYSYRSLEEAFMEYNNGNNFYSVMSASMLSKSFADSFRYPKGTLSDQNYVYAKATRKNPNGYRFTPKAEVLFNTVTTFHDWRLLSTRSIFGDKEDISKHFGKDILKEYTMPKWLIIKTQLKWLFRHPFYMLGSIVMNIVIRVFPYNKEKPKNGLWETTQSTKLRIFV